MPAAVGKKAKPVFTLGADSDDELSPSLTPTPTGRAMGGSLRPAMPSAIDLVDIKDAFDSPITPSTTKSTPPLSPESAALKASLMRWRSLGRAPEQQLQPPPLVMVTGERGMTLMSAVLSTATSPAQKAKKEKDCALLQQPSNLRKTADQFATWLEHRFPLTQDANRSVLGADPPVPNNTPVIPSLAVFIERVLTHSCAPTGSVNRALILADRLPRPSAVASPTERHRIFLASLVVSCKVAYDWCPSHRNWQRTKEWLRFAKPRLDDDGQPYFSLESLNKSEQQLLIGIHFNIDMTADEYRRADKVTTGAHKPDAVAGITRPRILVTLAG